jgi:hypothetical protein
MPPLDRKCERLLTLPIGYESVVIAQPSMLLGDRAALGQPPRSAEIWTVRLLAPLGWIMPKGVRPIPARAVASALVAATLDAKPGVRVLKSGAVQEMVEVAMPYTGKS